MGYDVSLDLTCSEFVGFYEYVGLWLLTMMGKFQPLIFWVVKVSSSASRTLVNWISEHPVMFPVYSFLVWIAYQFISSLVNCVVGFAFLLYFRRSLCKFVSVCMSLCMCMCVCVVCISYMKYIYVFRSICQWHFPNSKFPLQEKF